MRIFFLYIKYSYYIIKSGILHVPVMIRKLLPALINKGVSGVQNVAI